MRRMRLFLTACLLTGFIALAGLNAMASSNPKPVSGTSTISQGPTGPGSCPTPRPVGASVY
jgi:hypothetical protein